MAARLTALVVFAIVSATLIAGLIVGAQRDTLDGPVDLVILNGRVFTADGRGTMAEAVAIRGNQILHVGSNREIKRLRRRQTTVLDAHGGAVLPGFNDAHAHLVSGGLALDKLNLLDAVTLEDIETRISAYADAHPDRRWVQGLGWSYQAFANDLPTKDILDRLVPDRPAHMMASDGRTLWVNSKALEIAGITARTPSPKNGIIVKDPRTGEPTGALKEAAIRLVNDQLPETTRSEQLRALRAAVHEAHRLGITSAQHVGGSGNDLDLFDELRRDGDLQLRVYGTLSAKAGFDEGTANRFDELWKKYPDDPLFKTGAATLTIGVSRDHTDHAAAAVVSSAKRTDARRTPAMTSEELNRIVAMLDARGWQVMIDANDERGIRIALDAFAHAAQANRPPPRGRRHRVEHLETADPADVLRFGALGVIASMQPFQPGPTPGPTDVWASPIGPDQGRRGGVYRSISDSGGRLAFGSDWPAVTLDPRMGLTIAVSTPPSEGPPGGGSDPDQRLSLVKALEAYTSGGAWASFDDTRKGMLVPGMLADLVILSTDVFAPAPARLLDAVVTTTIFDGKVVYSRASSSND